MNFAAINPHLNARHVASLPAAVAKLEAAIAAGLVPNVLFNEAKNTFNSAVSNSAEAFLATGPHNAGHHQSDWWLGAYDSDAFVSGTTNVPTALKRATKKGLNEYAAFLTGLLPLHELLQKAKPLIKKKGEMPKAPTKRETERAGFEMTCQCCGRGIFANLGTIAHHGYERPGYGWQTSSCMGAKRLPFEVDRTALGEMIVFLRQRLANAEKHRAAIKSEKLPIVFDYETKLIGPTRYQRFGRFEKWPTVKRTFDVTRKSFDAFKAGPGSDSTYGVYDFDEYKAKHVEYLTRSIDNLKGHIKEEQARYDGWKATHKREGDQWVAL